MMNDFFSTPAVSGRRGSAQTVGVCPSPRAPLLEKDRAGRQARALAHRRGEAVNFLWNTCSSVGGDALVMLVPQRLRVVQFESGHLGDLADRQCHWDARQALLAYCLADL